MLKWEDQFDVKESKNSRGEVVFDIYRKGTDYMIWSDVANMQEVENVCKGMCALMEVVAADEMERLLLSDEE